VLLRRLYVLFFIEIDTRRRRRGNFDAKFITRHHIHPAPPESA
jgi:hypothetical protein